MIGVKDKVDNKTTQVIELFDNGYAAYLMQNWVKAEEYFNMALRMDPQDGPSKTYIERVNFFKTSPPEEGWDGAFTMTTK